MFKATTRIVGSNNVIRKSLLHPPQLGRHGGDLLDQHRKRPGALPIPLAPDEGREAARPSPGFELPLHADARGLEDQLDWNIPVTSVGGIPRGWCRAGAGIRIRPVPSSSNFRLRARVWDYPTPLTDASATNYWTLQHDDLIEDLATALGFRWLGDFERYNALLQAAMNELQVRITDDMKRLRPSRQTVAPGMRAGKPSSSVGPRIGEDGYYRQYSP